jgi:hypothetical protein
MARPVSKRDWFYWISRISFRADSLVYSLGAGKRSGAEADAEQLSHKAEAYPRSADRPRPAKRQLFQWRRGLIDTVNGK